MKHSSSLMMAVVMIVAIIFSYAVPSFAQGNAVSEQAMSDEIEIVCDGLGSTLTGTAYEDYTFSLNTSLVFETCSWRYVLPLQGGGSEEVASSTSGTSFTIPALNEDNEYDISDLAEVQGMITFVGWTADGAAHSVTCGITLDMKPYITQANIVSITPCSYDDIWYDVAFEVYYIGSHYVHMYLELEFDPGMPSKFSDNHNYTSATFYDVDSYGYAKIHIEVKNDYGSDKTVLKIPGTMSHCQYESLTLEELLADGSCTIEMYGIDGTYLGNVESMEELDESGERLVILRAYYGDTLVKTIKHLCK